MVPHYYMKNKIKPRGLKCISKAKNYEYHITNNKI